MENRLTRDERLVLAALMPWFAITVAWWLLALWPVHDAPAWLERTRYVCFGISQTGLPDAGGWIGLIAGPLGMLAILLIGWWRTFVSALHKPRAWLAVGPMALGVLLLAGGAAARVAEAREQAAEILPGRALPPENYPRLDQPTPPLSLVAQTGQTFTLNVVQRRPVLLTFAYAHCGTVCPLIVKDALHAQRLLRGTPDYPAVVIVTLDPWRDTPTRLPALAAAWQLPANDAWVLSGSVAQVQAVLTAWHIPRTRDESTGDITHPSLIYVIDRNGRIGFTSTGGSAGLAALVRRL